MDDASAASQRAVHRPVNALRTLLKRLALGMLLGLAAGIVCIATISLGHQTSVLPAELDGRRAMQRVGAGALLAGAARVELVAPPHGPIAGYPAWRRDDGTGEPVFVRALVLEQGELRAVLLSLPLLLLPGALEEEIVARANLPPTSCLLAAATHTHSGPGGTWNNALLELGGNGLYSPARADAVAKAAAEAIALARARLAPAHVAAGIEEWESGPAAPRSGPIDRAFAAARLLDADNRTLASIVVYGMHATVVPRSVHALSGDWPEAAARALEQLSDGAPALILQGAVGNATFSRESLPADPAQAAAQLGERVAAEAARVISSAELAPPDAPLSCSTRIVALPEPRAAPSIWRPVRRAAGNLLHRYAGRAALVSTLQLPGLLLLGIPGEPVGDLALLPRREHGGRAMLVGLADGYEGYIETPSIWALGEGESSRTWHGPDLAAALGIAPAPLPFALTPAQSTPPASGSR